MLKEKQKDWLKGFKNLRASGKKIRYMKPITLDFITNPDKMNNKDKFEKLSLALRKNLKKEKYFKKKNKKK